MLLEEQTRDAGREHRAQDQRDRRLGEPRPRRLGQGRDRDRGRLPRPYARALGAPRPVRHVTCSCAGDLHVDQHHTAEDAGIALGQAFAQALGDKKGIARYASFHLPMDETLSRVSVDISGRPFLVFRTQFPREKIGAFDTELVREWFQAFAIECRRHPACRDALWRERPPYRRELLQGAGAGAAAGGDASTRGKRGACLPPRVRCKLGVRSGDAGLCSRSAVHEATPGRAMTIYTVHMPAEPARSTSAHDTDGRLMRVQLVKDGFHWLALIFPLLWLLFNRIWWGLLAYVVLVVVVLFGGKALGLSDSAIGRARTADGRVPRPRRLRPEELAARAGEAFPPWTWCPARPRRRRSAASSTGGARLSPCSSAAPPRAPSPPARPVVGPTAGPRCSGCSRRRGRSR